MNEAMKHESDLAYLASVVDGGCSLYMRSGDNRVAMKIRVLPRRRDTVVELLKIYGFRIWMVDPLGRIGLVGQEVPRLFAQLHPHLRDDHARKLAQLSFRWWRTVQRTVGMHLTEDDRAERMAVAAELKAMREERAQRLKLNQGSA